MTLFALSFLTPYFYFIPRSALAAVLVTAVVFMIDWSIIPILWKGSSKLKRYTLKYQRSLSFKRLQRDV